MTIERLRKRNRIKSYPLIILLTFFSCSNEDDIQGASWEGGSDFMFITEAKMQMHYASVIPGNAVYIGGFYEVLKEQTTVEIDRLLVTKIEFDTRTDGMPYCRIWGRVTKSDELSYLLAEKCKPIYSN